MELQLQSVFGLCPWTESINHGINLAFSSVGWSYGWLYMIIDVAKEED